MKKLEKGNKAPYKGYLLGIHEYKEYQQYKELIPLIIEQVEQIENNIGDPTCLK